MATNAQASRSVTVWKSFVFYARGPIALVIGGVIAMLLVFLYLDQKSLLSNLTFEINRLGDERIDLARENAALRYEVAGWQSLSRIEERALRLGLTENVQVQLLAVSYPTQEGREAGLLANPLRPSVIVSAVGPEAGFWGSVQVWKEGAVRQFVDWVRSPHAGP